MTYKNMINNIKYNTYTIVYYIYFVITIITSNCILCGYNYSAYAPYYNYNVTNQDNYNETYTTQMPYSHDYNYQHAYYTPQYYTTQNYYPSAYYSSNNVNQQTFNNRYMAYNPTEQSQPQSSWWNRFDSYTDEFGNDVKSAFNDIGYGVDYGLQHVGGFMQNSNDARYIAGAGAAIAGIGAVGYGLYDGYNAYNSSSAKVTPVSNSNASVMGTNTTYPSGGSTATGSTLSVLPTAITNFSQTNYTAAQIQQANAIASMLVTIKQNNPTAFPTYFETIATYLNSLSKPFTSYTVQSALYKWAVAGWTNNRSNSQIMAVTTAIAQIWQAANPVNQDGLGAWATAVMNAYQAGGGGVGWSNNLFSKGINAYLNNT